MRKKKTPKAASALAQTVPPTQWSQIRTSERITYPDGAPDRVTWRGQGTYTGSGLNYRGQERRPIIALAGRPL